MRDGKRSVRFGGVVSGWALAAALALGCGGASEPPASGADAGARQASGPEGLSVEGAVGALDADAVRTRAAKVQRRAEGCVAEGRRKLPYLAGDVDVFLRVDQSGRAREVFFTRSTLGHLATETCILEAFEREQWPRPVGGKVGEISQSFGFDAGHPEAPVDWGDRELEKAMNADARGEEPPFRALLAKLGACKNEAGAASLLVTMYLDEDGLVEGVGSSAAGAQQRKAASCVVTVVETTSFPAAGKLIKATVRVP